MYAWLKYEKKQLKRSIKREIIAGLDRKDLVFLGFSKKEATEKLRWEHAKEFEYQDQMYDVVEREEHCDSVFYWCWWDHEETSLNQQLSSLLAQAWGHHPQKQEHHKKLLSVFKHIYSPQQNSQSASFYTYTSNTLKNTECKDILSPIYNIESPPPEIV